MPTYGKPWIKKPPATKSSGTGLKFTLAIEKMKCVMSWREWRLKIQLKMMWVTSQNNHDLSLAFTR